MYEPRSYRQQMGERFQHFEIAVQETDLWIGVPFSAALPPLQKFASDRIHFYREELEKYISDNPEFQTSFLPLNIDKTAPLFIQRMLLAGQQAQTGPMAAVAGTFSEFIAKDIQKKFSITDIIVENGGDIFLQSQSSLTLQIFAGKSVLSNKIGLVVPAGLSPVGVCTSAGTVGHSTSFGRADSVTVVCRDTALADAWATALGNRVQTADDIQPVLDSIAPVGDILSVIIIIGDRIGIAGQLEITKL